MYNISEGGVEMDNKNIFAANLKRYMDLREKSRRDISEDLGISYFTVTDWVKGKKYPRMDKVEKLADYFGIKKSDLIEEKTEEQEEMQKKADSITEAVLKMKTDSEFLSMVDGLRSLDADQRAVVKHLISTFLK
jgi:transcriptional regulator with XRE-family HTH domain